MFVWSNAQASRNVCKGIEVVIDGNGQAAAITKENVMEVLSGYPSPIVGRQLYQINTKEVGDYLMGFNNFETVGCIITSKGNLKVSVTPMIPAIRVFDGDKSYYVNKDGKTMTALPGFHVDVPIVTGKFSGRRRPESVLPVVNYITADSLLTNLVGMIKVADNSDILLIPRIRGHVINIGDTSRLDEKKRAIVTAYRNILPYKGWETYDTISVKFRGQIVATRRDKAPLYQEHPIEEIADIEEDALNAAVDSVPRN